MRVVFIGTGDIGLPSFRALIESYEHEVIGVVTQPDKPVGRRQVLQAPSIKTLALEHGIEVFQPERLRNADAIERVVAFRAEVIVVMAYGQILPKAILDAPSVACINLHASLLPRHRGASPIQAAIEAGDLESGVTVMHVDVGLDTGDMILSRKLTIRPDETGGSLHDRIADLAPAAMMEALRQLAEGTAARTPQDDSIATYAPKLSREHGVIDWNAACDAIDRKIRAMNPWPGASTTLPVGATCKSLKVFTDSVVPDRNGPPGTVLETGKDGLVVAAGSGAIRLGEVQLEGKKRMESRHLLLGYTVEVGTLLGVT